MHRMSDAKERKWIKNGLEVVVRVSDANCLKLDCLHFALFEFASTALRNY